MAGCGEPAPRDTVAEPIGPHAAAAPAAYPRAATARAGDRDRTALHDAAQVGDLARIDQLLQAGAELNVVRQ